MAAGSAALTRATRPRVVVSNRLSSRERARGGIASVRSTRASGRSSRAYAQTCHPSGSDTSDATTRRRAPRSRGPGRAASADREAARLPARPRVHPRRSSTRNVPRASGDRSAGTAAVRWGPNGSPDQRDNPVALRRYPAVATTASVARSRRVASGRGWPSSRGMPAGTTRSRYTDSYASIIRSAASRSRVLDAILSRVSDATRSTPARRPMTGVPVVIDLTAPIRTRADAGTRIAGSSRSVDGRRTDGICTRTQRDAAPP